MKATPSPVREVDPAEAERLITAGAVRVLDVRTPREYAELGHVPGAILLPVDWIPVAPATLRRDDRPLLVCCEHGMRSAFAAHFLSEAGFENVLNLRGGMSCWTGAREHSPGDPYGAAGPSSWLIENLDLLPRGGRTLDLACGAGRHALLLAAAGFQVRAVDRDNEKIDALRATATRLGLAIRAEVIDLEAADVDLGRESADLIVGIRYLHRPLFPALVRALAPGGRLLYETFTVDQASRGRPTNPAFLLRKGELRRLVAPLKVLRFREGEYDGGMVSAVVAGGQTPRGG
jgi:rhodanese-related sulfurtransferase